MSVTITPRTTVVTLLQGDDFDPIVENAEAVDKAARSVAPMRLGDTTDEVSEATESFNEFMETANDRALKVRLTALGRKAYRSLLNEHPVRMVDSEDGPVTHKDDANWGFNRETFGDALVPLCMGDEFGTLEEREAFLDSLADADFSKLYFAAINLNQGPGPDPKARLSSPRAPTSDETSSSPARLA